jgi:hypothetical protein
MTNGEPKLSAHLELLQQEAAPGATLRYVLVNDGDAPILTGTAYRLDRQVDSHWQPLELRAWFTAVALIVAPGQRRELSTPLPTHIKPGRYRLRKRIRAQANGPAAPSDVTAEFEVRGVPRPATRQV